MRQIGLHTHIRAFADTAKWKQQNHEWILFIAFRHSHENFTATEGFSYHSLAIQTVRHLSSCDAVCCVLCVCYEIEHWIISKLNFNAKQLVSLITPETHTQTRHSTQLIWCIYFGLSNVTVWNAIKNRCPFDHSCAYAPMPMWHFRLALHVEPRARIVFAFWWMVIQWVIFRMISPMLRQLHAVFSINPFSYETLWVSSAREKYGNFK